MEENLDGEEWKDIIGYEGLYQVSNFGRVKSLIGNHGQYREKIMKLSFDNYGYLKLSLNKKGKSHTITIHRLVAIHFIPIPEHLKDIPIEKLQINHLSEIKTDNRVENLEWCTAEYNDNYGTRNERRVEKQSKTVLQFDLFGNFIKEWKNTNECGRNSFCQSEISRCCRGITKTHKGYIWKYKKNVEQQ